jgi:dimethylargininase
MATVLSEYRPVHWLRSPATLDGGDVLTVGKTLYVGRTPRTNAAAVEQLCALLAPRGYRVVAVPITQCLHLKSACARMDDTTVLLNPAWVDQAVFDGASLLAVAESEPWGANAVRAGNTVIFPASEPRTRTTVERRGFRTVAVDVSELQKAEAGVTCLSLVFED